MTAGQVFAQRYRTWETRPVSKWPRASV